MSDVCADALSDEMFRVFQESVESDAAYVEALSCQL